MVGDTIGVTTDLSLYQLTTMATANGTFVVSEQGTTRAHFIILSLNLRSASACVAA